MRATFTEFGSCPMAPLAALAFDNQILRSLPLDEGRGPRHEPRTVRGACFSAIHPPLEPLDNPRLVSVSAAALALLDLSVDQVGG